MASWWVTIYLIRISKYILNRYSILWMLVITSECWIWLHQNCLDSWIKLIARPTREKHVCHVDFPIAGNRKSWVISLIADSTDTENFSRPMGYLVETICGNNKNTTLLPGNVVASAPTTPLQMSFLDSLTVHAKMR